MAGDGSWQPISDGLQADPERVGWLSQCRELLACHFGSTVQGVSVETAAGTLGVVPAGASAVQPALNAVGDGVTLRRRVAGSGPHLPGDLRRGEGIGSD